MCRRAVPQKHELGIDMADLGDGDVLEMALREAAQLHAAEITRERSAAREAAQRAQKLEAALRALPQALQRAEAAEAALKALQVRLDGQLVGSDAKALLREAIRSFDAPDGSVGSVAATQAAAQAASAGWEAASAAARAEEDALVDLLGMELAVSEAATATETQLLLLPLYSH